MKLPLQVSRQVTFLADKMIPTRFSKSVKIFYQLCSYSGVAIPSFVIGHIQGAVLAVGVR